MTKNQEFALLFRMLCAFAFLPPNAFAQRFEDLVDHIRWNYNFDEHDLLQHFEMLIFAATAEMSLVVSQCFLSIYGICSTEQKKDCQEQITVFTAQKNEFWSYLLKKSLMENFIFCAVIEVWHRSFQVQFSSCHPNLWKYLKVLQNREFDKSPNNTEFCWTSSTTRIKATSR